MQGRARRISVGRALLLAVVVLLHLSLVLMPWQREQLAPAGEESISELFLVEDNKVSIADVPVPATTPLVVPAPNTSIVEPQPATIIEPDAAPAIDWTAEAQTAASNAIRTQEEKQRMRHFDRSDQRQRLPLDTRGPEMPEFEWNKESTERFGLTPEGLFFLRLSQRCMIVGVFLACGFGELPPPNADLFEHMGDANVPSGSVPEVNDTGIIERNDR